MNYQRPDTTTTTLGSANVLGSANLTYAFPGPQASQHRVSTSNTLAPPMATMTAAPTHQPQIANQQQHAMLQQAQTQQAQTTAEWNAVAAAATHQPQMANLTTSPRAAEWAAPSTMQGGSSLPTPTTAVPAAVEDIFNRLDRDGDGVLTRQEFTIGTQPPRTTREVALAQRVVEQEHRVLAQDKEIRELEIALESFYGLPEEEVLSPRSAELARRSQAERSIGPEPVGGVRGGASTKTSRPRSPRTSKSNAGQAGQRGMEMPNTTHAAETKPLKLYKAVDRHDPIDVRLEEYYNGTCSAVPFKRINRGFYRFGDTTLELKIVNSKLMVQTEDGWNRGKFGSIEKFMITYETIEREKLGIPLDRSGM